MTDESLKEFFDSFPKTAPTLICLDELELILRQWESAEEIAFDE